MAVERKLTELYAMIRRAGLAHVDMSKLTQTASGTFIGRTEVDGKTYFYEVKVTAKRADFTEEDFLELVDDYRLSVAKDAERKRKAEEKAKKKAEKQ